MKMLTIEQYIAIWCGIIVFIGGIVAIIDCVNLRKQIKKRPASSRRTQENGGR